MNEPGNSRQKALHDAIHCWIAAIVFTAAAAVFAFDLEWPLYGALILAGAAIVAAAGWRRYRLWRDWLANERGTD